MATVPFTPAAEPTVAVSQSQLAALINLLQQAQNVVAAIVPPIGNHAALVVTDNTICYFCQKLGQAEADLFLSANEAEALLSQGARAFVALVQSVHAPAVAHDFRALNKITVRDRFPLPLIDDLFDKLQGCTVFSSMDLQSGYHQILIPAEDVPKTAFSTPTGHYQYKPSPAQPSPAQPSPAQPSPAQPSPAQPSPAQPSPAQPSPAQPSPAQPSPAQPSPAQPSPAQPSPAQPSPAQPSPAQPSPAQPSPAQPSPAQPSPTQPNPTLPPCTSH
ncbi:hypothetical protein V8C86DRAFT_3105879 [Haematococcus lacustris]